MLVGVQIKPGKLRCWILKSASQRRKMLLFSVVCNPKRIARSTVLRRQLDMPASLTETGTCISNGKYRILFQIRNRLLTSVSSDSVWDNCSNEAKRQLDSIHHEAARIITGGIKLCSLEKLLADLGWDSLQERRTKHKLVIFYKIINNLTPNYLQEFVPPLVQDGNPYRLRNSAIFTLFILLQICFITRFIPH